MPSHRYSESVRLMTLAAHGVPKKYMGVLEADKHAIQKDFSDWQYVFGEADGSRVSPEVIAHNTHDEPVLRADIDAVAASVNGENDGEDWICLCLMIDGRWLAAHGGCDYTGWG